MTLNVGDIILLEEFKYPDGSRGSRHYFVIIDKQTGLKLPDFDELIDLYFSMLISSKQSKAREYSTNPNHYFNLTITDDKKISNLPLESHVKVDQLYELTSFDLERAKLIGRISLEQLEKIKELFKEAIEKDKLQFSSR